MKGVEENMKKDNIESSLTLEKIDKQLRDNFVKFRKNLDLAKYTIEDVLWLCYFQGHLDSTPKEIDIPKEEFETMCFLNFIKDCIADPKSISSSEHQYTDYVKVTYPCEGHDKCIAWPDRCEDIGGNGGNYCTVMLNLSKLCGVQELERLKNTQKKDNKLLTTEEIELFGKILSKFLEKD